MHKQVELKERHCAKGNVWALRSGGLCSSLSSAIYHPLALHKLYNLSKPQFSVKGVGNSTYLIKFLLEELNKT